MAQESWNCDAAEGGGCQQQESLVLCPNNCGLFGCAATMNLCPKCYREVMLKKQGNPVLPEKVAAAMAASVHKPPTSASPSVAAPVCLAHIYSSSQASSAPESPCYSPRGNAVEPVPSSPSPKKSPLPSSQLSTLFSSPDLCPFTALFSSDEKESQPAAWRRSINRCFNCRKRTGLLGFKCRCGNVFCGQHRYSYKHGCPFDYKSAGREAIAKANPIVKARKVEKI